MASRSNRWIAATRLGPLLFACGLLRIAYNAAFNPISAEEMAGLEERRDPGGLRRERARRTVEAYSQSKEEEAPVAAPTLSLAISNVRPSTMSPCASAATTSSNSVPSTP
jgi:hypothetical protein